MVEMKASTRRRSRFAAMRLYRKFLSVATSGTLQIYNLTPTKSVENETFRLKIGRRHTLRLLLPMRVGAPYWLLTAFITTTLAQGAEHVSSGNYQIRFCDRDNQAEKIQAYLPHIWENIQKVIADAALGISSPYGFSALFKSNDNIANVTRLFQNIANGAPVYVSPGTGRSIDFKIPKSPTFVCVNAGKSAALDSWLNTWCEPSRRIDAIYNLNSEYIFLCPSFWNLEQEEPDSTDCPRLRRNALTPNDGTLTLNQQSVLVHELAHMYGASGFHVPRDGKKEVYLPMEAVNLNAADSLLNAENFALYYTCKFSFPMTSISAVQKLSSKPNSHRP